jgi:hypothetical protein
LSVIEPVICAARLNPLNCSVTAGDRRTTTFALAPALRRVRADEASAGD